MTNITDTNQLASLQQLIWIYTVYKGRAYPGTAEPGLFKIAQGKRGVSTCFFFFYFSRKSYVAGTHEKYPQHLFS